MSTFPTRCVVDASAGIKLFVVDAFSEQAHGLFNRLADDPPAVLFVPDLFFIECTNILWKYSHRFGRSINDSLSDLADLGRLALRVVSTADLMEEAFSLATETGLTAYDACYAALAHQLNLPLVTVNEQLIKSVRYAIWLGDLGTSI